MSYLFILVLSFHRNKTKFNNLKSKIVIEIQLSLPFSLIFSLKSTKIHSQK